MLRFGAVTESTCKFELSRLVTGGLPRDANTFFDLFILDRKGNLIDVPVLIRNFKNAKGELVN
jgi:hypothetical protein